jgi:hypothetical protein
MLEQLTARIVSAFSLSDLKAANLSIFEGETYAV